jgi:hypothetical protein
MFLIYPTIAVSSWFEEEPDDRSFLAFIFALVSLSIAGRLFRNAIRRPPQNEKGNDGNP